MDHCSACKHYLGGRCEIVSGVVLPGDWCNKFEKETMMLTAGEFNAQESKKAEAARKKADARTNYPNQGIKEHALHITSRTTGKSVEVCFGPNGGGLVPANPFASLAQARFAHANPEKFGGKTALDEWDKSTNFKKLPKKVKKSK